MKAMSSRGRIRKISPVMQIAEALIDLMHRLEG